MNKKLHLTVFLLLICISNSVAQSYRDSKLFTNLTRMSKVNATVNLLYDSTNIETSSFTDEDWQAVKNVYYAWRRAKIKTGHYVAKCNDDDESTFYKYALPVIPKKITKFPPDSYAHFSRSDLDTLMADINFDGKTDIIFLIIPEICNNGVSYGAPLPEQIVLPVVSKNERYRVVEEPIFGKVIKKIQYFNCEVGYDQVHPELFDIKSITTKDGIFIISGISNADERIDDDPLCCPTYSFYYKFTYFIDKKGKGYGIIEGKYYVCEEKCVVKKKFTIKIK
jgi:hypothetical protein